MKGTTLTDQYSFTSTGAYPELEVKGKLPIAGSIALNDNCEVVASLTDGNYVVTKSLLSEEYTINDGDDANDNIISPLNSKVKVNDIYYSLEMRAPINLDIFSDPEIKTFLSTDLNGGFNVTYDESNKVIGAFELVVIPNTYTREVARDYAIRTLNQIKAYEIGNEITGTIPGIYYYITDDYIFLMEGFKEITDPVVQAEFQAQYEEILPTLEQNNSEMPFEHIRIEY